jgi:hypothetical protein
MASSVECRHSGWLNGRQASLQIGCSPTALLRLGLIGRIRTKLEPGSPPRYSAEDVARIARDCQRQGDRPRKRPARVRREPERAGA